MDAKRILDFLRQVMNNNNRPWFQEHKAEYEAVRSDFEHGVGQASIATPAFHPTSPLTRIISVPISMPRARRRSEEATMSIWSRGIAWWPWVTIGCLRIY